MYKNSFLRSKMTKPTLCKFIKEKDSFVHYFEHIRQKATQQGKQVGE